VNIGVETSWLIACSKFTTQL